jgi:hypothetical protein
MEIEFKYGGVGRELLVSGWCETESTHTWTRGTVSRLRFPNQFMNCDLTLEISCYPHVQPGKLTRQRCQVLVDGTSIAHLVVRRAMSFELYIPREIVIPEKDIEFEFRCPDAWAPLQLGASNDHRVIGLAMKVIRLNPLTAEPPDLATHRNASDADVEMLMNVQSLGINCEVGFFQRWAGAEPLGLFRWADTPLPNLIEAFEQRFEGFGQPDNVRIETDDASEFWVVDTKYGFRNHSYSFERYGATADTILDVEVSRLRFLLKSFIVDLRTGRKLLTYHDIGQSTQSDVGKLAESVQSYGPNTLLWLVAAEKQEQVGKIEIIAPGFVKGFIDGFQSTGALQMRDSYDGWLDVVRAAHDYQKATFLQGELTNTDRVERMSGPG